MTNTSKWVSEVKDVYCAIAFEWIVYRIAVRAYRHGVDNGVWGDEDYQFCPWLDDHDRYVHNLLVYRSYGI